MLDPINTYRTAGCLVVTSIIASVVSIMALLLALPHHENISYDYHDSLVTTLSVLVTVLIGWNIYTIIDLRTYEKNIKESADNQTKKITESINVLKCEITNNINTAVDLLSNIAEDYEISDKLSTYLSFYSIASRNGSEAVKVSLLRIISNIIIVENKKGVVNSFNLRKVMVNKAPLEVVKLFADDYSSTKPYNDVVLWLNKLMEEIKEFNISK